MLKIEVIKTDLIMLGQKVYLLALFFVITASLCSGCGGSLGGHDSESSKGEVEELPSEGAQSPSEGELLLIVNISPNDNASGVSVDVEVRVEFSEPMDSETINGDSFVLRKLGGSEVTGSLTFSDEGEVVSFSPSFNLDYETTYVVAISSEVKSVAGEGLPEEYSWEFSTAGSPPSIIGISPKGKASGVSVDVEVRVEFSEPMDSETINGDSFVLRKLDGSEATGSLTFSNGGEVVSFSPSYNLDYETTYVVTISSDVKSVAGEGLPEEYSWEFYTDKSIIIQLPCYKYQPSADLDNYDTEEDFTILNFSKEVDLAQIALLVIDFWRNEDSVKAGAMDNTASLIGLARRHNIQVIHLPHEGYISPGIDPRIEPLSNEPIWHFSPWDDTLLEDFLREHGKTILFYTGYGAQECLMWSRNDSLNTMTQRYPDEFDVVLFKDTTWSTFWEYHLTVNAVETVFQTSTLSDLADALSDSVVTEDFDLLPSKEKNYVIDEDFGKEFNVDDHTLVLLNVWDEHDNDGFEDRIKENNEGILSMLQYARAQNMEVIHIPNDRNIDPCCTPIEGEVIITSKKDLWDYMIDNDHTTIIWVGNITNSTALFPTIDIWGFSLRNGYTQSIFGQFDTVFLEDSIVVYEISSSLPGEDFKHTFLSRATAYEKDRHKVSKRSIFLDNVGN